jgi:small subunit ribosomal protein S2
VVAIVDTNCSPDSIEYVIPGNDDAMRAISLYAGGMAEAVIEGKASVPTMAVGEDEFVELDEGGQPKKKTARGRQRPQATVRKKAPARRRLAPVKALTQSEESPVEGLEEPDEADEAEAIAAVVAPLAAPVHPPASARRKSRGDADDGGVKED